jgi:hypothetical protein
MKMKFIIGFGIILLTVKSYSQQTNFNSLLGRWVAADTTIAVATPVFTFIDKSTLLFEYKDLSYKCPYRLDTSKTVAAIYFTLEALDKRENVKFLIKLTSDTLKMQGLNNLKLSEWQLPENPQNTGVLIKRNK